MRAPAFSVYLAIVAALTAGMVSAQAQTKSTGLALSNDKPIQIGSDNLEIREQEKKALFTGNVKVVQGAMTLESSKMIVYYKSGTNSIAAGGADIDHIEVDGKVKLYSATQTATGDSGNFNMITEELLLQGKKVVLTEGGNVFTGCKLTVQMKTGLANLGGCGGRVEILLDSNSKK